MEIVFTEGLGDQMFQYALYTAIRSLGRKPLMNIGSIMKSSNSNGFELGKAFLIDENYSLTENKRKMGCSSFFLRQIESLLCYNENEDFFSDKVFCTHKKIIKGHWYNYLYFERVSERVRHDFVFRNIDAGNKALGDEMMACNSVAIHIMRRNYMNKPSLQVCTPSYYTQAISFIKDRVDLPIFYVFSDDQEWCSRFMSEQGVDYKIVCNNPSEDNYKDMYLMTCCHHNIIFNNSFSWWGAWLGNQEGRIIICPSLWEKGRKQTPYLDNWNKIMPINNSIRINPFFYCSFDVFDTCLLRTFGEPGTLFDLLARAVLGKDAQESEIFDFSKIRKDGELLARKHYCGIYEDISLECIYYECDFSQLTDIPRKEILKIEMQLEERFLKPIKKTKSLIEKIHDQGKSLLFLTDMYLPSAFIQNVLRKYGLFKDGDSIVVSNEAGLSKRTGKLYKYIKLNTGRHLWAHYGDNKRVDVRNAFKKGVIGIKRNLPYTYYEKKFFKSNRHPNFSPLRLSSSISRYVYNNTGGLLAADFMAPIYVSFTCKVLLDAKKRGIKQIYFIARDSYPLYRIAKILAPVVSPDLLIKYLYISRKSTYLATLPGASKEDIIELYNKPFDNSLLSLLDMLRVEIESFTKDELLVMRQLKNRELIEYLFNKPNIVNLIHKNKIKAESNLLSYLTQEGIGKEGCALVDLRGTRSSLVGLNKLLVRNGLNSVFSYYFEVSRFRVKTEDISRYSSYLYGERYDKWNKHIPKASSIFEEYFSANEQRRTADYEQRNEKWIPIFEENIADNIDHRKKIGETNIISCEMYAESFLSLSLMDHCEEILNNAISLFDSFMKAPHPDYLNELRGFRISDSSISSTPLISRFLYKRNQTGWTRGSLFYILFTIRNPFY